MANGREYGEEEIWVNFKYFLDKVLPVCQEANVKIAFPMTRLQNPF
jgi:mannonate dehydratase